MTSADDAARDKITENLQWLVDHPEFDERPPSIVEFLGPYYLNILDGVRPRIFKELVAVFGDEFTPGRIAQYSEFLFTGAIGIGKTTIASIVLSYMVCCTLCLRDPQRYYGLLPGSKIAFMMMSTKRTQAIQVIFSDTKARITNSPWFRERFPFDPDYKNLLAWPQKSVWIIPGDSLETTFEGYNILGGVIDEIDSHKITPTTDYAESGYTTISSRITSRFGSRGFLVLIGQTKTEGGFAMRRVKEFETDPTKYVVKLTIWESLPPENYCGDSFYYDLLRHQVVHADEMARLGVEPNPDLYLRVPIEYLSDFTKDPDKALRDLAGIPRKVEDPFIRNTERIVAAQEAYEKRYPNLPRPWKDGRLVGLFRCFDSLPRVGHIDLAYSAETGDAAGIGIGHISHYVDTDDGQRPFLVIDALVRLLPPAGRQLEISDVRQIVYDLQQRGFKIKKVTLDGFQSTETMQAFRRRHIRSELLSVDKNLLPYSDLRDALYDERIAIPRVVELHRRTDMKPTDIVFKELSELGYTPNGAKVDHPPSGSKDLADALAGTVHNLMQRARKGATTAPQTAQLNGGTPGPERAQSNRLSPGSFAPGPHMGMLGAMPRIDHAFRRSGGM